MMRPLTIPAKKYLLCITIVCLAMLCTLGMFFYVLISSPFYGFNTLETQIQHTETMISTLTADLDHLEMQLQTKETSFNHLYTTFLCTKGKLSAKTITLADSTRLRLSDAQLLSSLARDNASQVSRNYPRYAPQTFDITSPSAVTAFELDYIFKDTPLQGLGNAFITAESNTGINAIFLASIAIHESNWGNSALATDRNNLFGFGAYTNTPDSALEFSSKEEAIYYVAQFLRDHYIDGDYYRGHTILDINRLYAADKNWSLQVFATMQKIDQTLQDHKFSNL